MSAVLKNWQQSIDPQILDLAAEAVHNKCTGKRTFSNLMAQELQAKLHSLSHTAHTMSEPHHQLAAALALRVRDIIMVISFAPQTTPVLRLVELAKSRGVFIIAITQNNSPLASRGDRLLSVEAAEPHDAMNLMDVVILQTITIESLAILVRMKQSEPAG